MNGMLMCWMNWVSGKIEGDQTLPVPLKSRPAGHDLLPLINGLLAILQQLV
jgi:hypothetical protein